VIYSFGSATVKGNSIINLAIERILKKKTCQIIEGEESITGEKMTGGRGHRGCGRVGRVDRSDYKKPRGGDVIILKIGRFGGARRNQSESRPTGIAQFKSCWGKATARDLRIK